MELAFAILPFQKMSGVWRESRSQDGIHFILIRGAGGAGSVAVIKATTVCQCTILVRWISRDRERPAKQPTYPLPRPSIPLQIVRCPEEAPLGPAHSTRPVIAAKCSPWYTQTAAAAGEVCGPHVACMVILGACPPRSSQIGPQGLAVETLVAHWLCTGGFGPIFRGGLYALSYQSHLTIIFTFAEKTTGQPRSRLWCSFGSSCRYAPPFTRKPRASPRPEYIWRKHPNWGAGCTASLLVVKRRHVARSLMEGPSISSLIWNRKLVDSDLIAKFTLFVS